MNLSFRVFALLLAPAVAAFAADSDIFRNPTAGFEMTKPAEWQFLTADQNLENLKSVKLNDEEFQKYMAQYATAPLVVLAKYPEPYDDVNPSFKVNIKPFGALKGQSATEILNLILPQFQRIFQDFELVQPPAAVDVSGIESGYARIHYTMQVPDVGAFPIASELWIVPRGDYFFMIGAGTRQDEGNGTRAEIQEILSTVRISREP